MKSQASKNARGGGGRLRRPAAASLLALLLVLVFAAQASATAYFHPFISTFGKKGTPQSSFEGIQNNALAVDQSTHDVYVLDGINEGEGQGKMYRFTSAGAPDNFAEGPHAGTNVIPGLTLRDGAQIAIAPAGAVGGTEGDIYLECPSPRGVGNGGPAESPGLVEVFSSQGVHLATLDGSGNPNADTGGDTGGIAVDSAGDVYVSYVNEEGGGRVGHIDKYVPSANPVANSDFDSELTHTPFSLITTGKIPTSGAMAAGASALYVHGEKLALSLFPGGGGSVDATGLGVPFGAQSVEYFIPTISVDPATEDVYYGPRAGNGVEKYAFPGYFSGVEQFDSAGELISRITVPDGPEPESHPYGAGDAAVDGASGRVYVWYEASGGARRVRIYGPGVVVAPPTASLDPVTNFNYESAHFSGAVNAGGSGEAQETGYRFACTPQCPGLQGERQVAADGADHAVSDETTGLQPETSYEVKLIATNANGVQSVEDSTTFETAAKPPAQPPEVTIEGPTEVAATSVRLNGAVNPNGNGERQVTQYHFEYTPASEYYGVDEQQHLTIAATAGAYTVTFDGPVGPSTGTGTLASGSAVVTGVKTSSREPFAVGQTITGSGIPAGTKIEGVGTGTLTLSAAATESLASSSITGDWVTSPIAFDATAAQVQTALRQLPPIGSSGVSVSGGPGDGAGSSPYALLFEGPLANRNLDQVAVNGAGLSGGAGARVATTTQGRALFDGAPSAPGGQLEPGEAFVPVSVVVPGLQPNTKYYVRLVAETAGGTAASMAPDPSFTTPATAPLAEATGATHVLASSAQLNARIDPANSHTTYYFQWGPHDCASGPCTSVPASEDGDAGSGGEYVFVSAQIEGLAPGSEYSYRLIATNAAGATATGPVAFATAPVPAACPNEALRAEQASTSLPDCRAWEMVSPRQKNGGDVSPSPDRSRAAVDGNAVSFASTVAFAGATGVNDAGAEYVSRRGGPEGWTTYPISPRQASPPIPSALGKAHFVGEFSPDLSSGTFLSLTPLPGITSANVAGVSDLYVGSGLGSSSPSMALASDSAAPVPDDHTSLDTGYVPSISLAGHSADFTHLVFETPYNLTPDALGEEDKAYEWVDGNVRLAGVLPPTACASPPCAAPVSIVGNGAATVNIAGKLAGSNYTEPSNAISRDGSRVFFTAGALVHSTGVNDDVGFEGDLYLREDGATTMQIDASERTHPLPGGRSEFQWATPGGSEVFFLSTKSLVDEDQDGGERDLYRYDLNAPAGHRLTLMTPDRITPDALGIAHVVGGSEDGSILYFIGGSNGSRPLFQRLYVLHGDMVRPVGAREEAGRAVGKGVTNWGDQGFNSDGMSMLRVSPDGRHVIFQSLNDQGLGYDNHDSGSAGYCALDNTEFEQHREGEAPDRCAELFLYSYDSGETVCVSCNPSGALPKGNASFDTRLSNFLPPESADQHLPRALSADGRYVFFNSRDALVPQDGNGKVDVYEYDTESGKLALISSGQCNCDSVFLGASASGEDVFFATRQQLVVRDPDNLYDVYDARVNGGIASQNELPPPGCEGDACQATPSPPAVSTPSSGAFSGPGNLAPPAPRKAHHRRHGRHRHRRRRGHRRRHGQGAGRRHRANAKRRSAK